MPPGRLPGEVFQACPTGKRPQGRPRTRWRDYVSQLAWERLGVPPEELEEVSGEKENTLEHENSVLKNQVKTLQSSLEKLEGQLNETQKMYEEKLKECCFYHIK
ncbi:hypothetical protein QTP70_004402 [Hemibagrus guttatus]|uniref:Uncharacterized protein n=1 Tax=Hemibagrus guttatus TaxID=175788 RepID=A0AAE0QSW0_9TELE|nr:hypothetical protein QTP70_004402 [Hemibagrus guttatus]